MNKLNLPGKLLSQKGSAQEKRLTFKQIKNNMNEGVYIRPPFQTDLDDNKVEQMITAYLANPEYLMFKDKIVVAVVINNDSDSETKDNYKLYLVDGQHRMEMAKSLYEEHEIDDSLILCYYKIDNEEQMKKLFLEINKDSLKNEKYVSLADFQRNIVDLLRDTLREKYMDYFAKTKKVNGKLLTISEFVNGLISNGYINKFNNVDELIDDIMTKNKKFYREIDYHQYWNDNVSLFYIDEVAPVRDKFIFGLKNNNFVEYLGSDKTIPDHHFKTNKVKISPKLRIQVWRKEFGVDDSGICPFYKCENKITNDKNGFQCGHIVAESKGGETVLDNLRPICKDCNCKMGSKNWLDYQMEIKIIDKQKRKILKTAVIKL
jgi:hypothetical protein